MLLGDNEDKLLRSAKETRVKPAKNCGDNTPVVTKDEVPQYSWTITAHHGSHVPPPFSSCSPLPDM